MSEYLRDSDVLIDASDEADRTTLKMPEEKLKVLVAKSTPPAALGQDVAPPQKDDRISTERAFVLSTPWAAHH